MELSKTKKFLTSINYPLFVLLGYSIKCMYFNPTYQDTIIIGLLSMLAGSFTYMKDFFRLKEKVITENDFRVAINNDIADLKNKLTSVSMSVKGNPFGGRK